MKQRKMTIRLVAIGLVGLFALALALPALAFEGRGGDVVVVEAGK